jgi:hypothetical protein
LDIGSVPGRVSSRIPDWRVVAITMGDDCTTGCASVNVSLNQAIEIHAKALAHRFGDRAPLLAQEEAHDCSASGDNEGHAVWLRVAAVAEMILKVNNRQHQSQKDT